METRGRALYNLLRMNWQEEQNLPVEDWQVEDYRSLSQEQLFSRLKDIGIPLDETHFNAFVEEVSSPEELLEAVYDGEDLTRYDQAYLVIFELWRKLAPEKQSLSVFCDHLDHLIESYDREELEDPKELYDALAELEQVLDEHVDQGIEPKQIFVEIAYYFAHDLESFIYDFASDLIDEGQDLYASEILDAFEPYIQGEKWFEFLHIRLRSREDQEEAIEALRDLLGKEQSNPDLEFYFDVARFLINRGGSHYYLETISAMKPLLHTEQDFQELLAMTCQFYALLDYEKKALLIEEILKERSQLSLEREISSDDRDVKRFFDLIKDHDWSEA